MSDPLQAIIADMKTCVVCKTEKPRSDFHRNAGACKPCKKLRDAGRTRSYQDVHGKTWRSMLNRCLNTESSEYPNYGGRGITVCKRWLTLENFAADMGPRPAGTSLDRIDNEKGYSPDNCRWATWFQQVNNRRGSVTYEHEGQRKSLHEWAERLGISYDALRKRIKYRGYTFEQAISEPVRGNCA